MKSAKGKKTITIGVSIDSPLDKVWVCWTNPAHITQWNFAVEDWHCPSAENDLKASGRFNWRMEAKDGSMGFDYCGNYQKIIPKQRIITELDDGRMVELHFTELDHQVNLTEAFDVEDINSFEQQKAGWLAILENFKKYVESSD